MNYEEMLSQVFSFPTNIQTSDAIKKKEVYLQPSG